MKRHDGRIRKIARRVGKIPGVVVILGSDPEAERKRKAAEAEPGTLVVEVVRASEYLAGDDNDHSGY